MDDQRTAEAINRAPAATPGLMRRINWKRFGIGLAIYAVMMLAGRPVFWFLGMNLIVTGTLEKRVVWLDRAMIIYIIVAICCAVLGAWYFGGKRKE